MHAKRLWIILLSNGSVQPQALLTSNGDGTANHRALSICYKYCRTTRKCVAFGKKLYWFGYKTTFPVRIPGALWSYQTTPLISILNQTLSCVYQQNMIPCTQGCVAWETNVSERGFFSRFTHPRGNNNVIIAPTVNAKKISFCVFNHGKQGLRNINGPDEKTYPGNLLHPRWNYINSISELRPCNKPSIFRFTPIN